MRGAYRISLMLCFRTAAGRRYVDVRAAHENHMPKQ